MHRRLQFDMRENPASERRHGSRLVLSAQLKPEKGKIQSEVDALPDNTAHKSETFEPQVGKAPSRATGGKSGDCSQLLTVEEAAELLRVPVSWVYGRMRKRSSERLPAYRLGKYWRFQEDEIRRWVQRQRAEHLHD
jgi:excisionase family DNA binding protein